MERSTTVEMFVFAWDVLWLRRGASDANLLDMTPLRLTLNNYLIRLDVFVVFLPITYFSVCFLFVIDN